MSDTSHRPWRRRPTPEQEGRSRARAAALRLAVIYALAAGAWVAFSDRMLSWLKLPLDLALFVGAIKGLAFVLVTAILLYIVAVRHLDRLYTSEERHQRLFHNATEGITLLRVVRDDFGKLADLVVDDVNPSQSIRLRTLREDLIGHRKSEGGASDRLSAYFDLVTEGIRVDMPVRRELAFRSDGSDELIAAFPIEDDLWAVAAMDITEIRRAQQALLKRDEWIRDAYVDVLGAVTGGKLMLLGQDEIEAELGERISPVGHVASVEGIRDARRDVQAVVEQRYPALAESASMQNPLGEALNNVIKHTGGGEYAVFLRDHRLQILVSDYGPGIDFRTLPKAALVAGFSTASTLGLGFTIMLQLCDRLLISTHPGRTIVVLEWSTEPVAEAV